MSSPQPLRPTKELEDALAEFQDLLSDEQKAQLEALTATTPGPPSPDAVLLFTAQVDTHNARRKSRCVASRISGLLESVQQFTAIVDTFVSSRPTIAALVWGGLKVFILAASNFSTFFDELTTCFMNVQRLCPRYGNYEFLYKDSLPLQQSLCTFYTSLIRFCTRAMSFLKREGFLQLAKSFFTTFQSEFGVLKKEMERNSEDVERWLRFASDRAADEERQQLRKWRSSFHIFSDKDREWKFSQGQRIRKSRNGRILDRLSNFDHRNALKRLRKKRFQNPNGLWLTQTTQYQEWLQKDGSSVFMLSGKMGSGKSVLSAAIVDDILLQQLPTNCLRTFFFCEHDNARSLTARTILGSLMRQCIPLDEFPAMLETDLYELLDNEGPNGDSLGSFLVAHSDVARTHIIMIDGLDECSEFERQVVFATFNSLLKLSKPRFKFFLSGRDDIMPDVHEQLQADFRMTMSCPAVCNDIEAVIDASLNEKQRKRKLVVQDSNLLHHVRAALISGAHGMFLWVDLMIEDLCAQTCDDDIRDTVDHLPATLAEVFERALLRIIKAGHSDIACKMFSWAAAARRPLSLEEMREAIAIEPCQSSLNVGKLVNKIDRMISWSGNLLVLEEEESLVQFAHHSAREYLQSSFKVQPFDRFHIDLRNAERAAGEGCVTYLSFTEFERQLSTIWTSKSSIMPLSIAKAALPGGTSPAVKRSWTKLEKVLAGSSKSKFDVVDQLRAVTINDEKLRFSESLRQKFCLLAYASEYWLDHTSDFAEGDCKSYSLWKNLAVTEKPHVAKPWTTEQWDNSDMCILRFIVHHRHTALMSLMMDLDMARIGASGALSDEEIRYLLEASIQILNDTNDWIQTPSYVSAATLTQEDVITNLSAFTAPENKDKQAFGEWASPRFIQRSVGRTAAAQLSPSDAQSNWAPSSPGVRCTSHCVKFALLKAAAENAQDKFRTYLALPFDAILLQSEDLQVSVPWTPLSVAASKGQTDVMEMILDHPSFPSMLQASGGRAVQRAIEVASAEGHLEIVSLIANKIFHNHKAEFEMLSKSIIAASFGGRQPDVVRYIERGADVDEQHHGTKVSALIAASAGGRINVLTTLISVGANVNLTDSAGNTALHLVNQVPKMIGLLVESGADLEARNKLGRTPLCHAAMCGRIDVLRRFVDAGARVNSADTLGRSALHHICRWAISDPTRPAQTAFEVVKILLSAGASALATELYTGRTPRSYLLGGIERYLGEDQWCSHISFIMNKLQAAEIRESFLKSSAKPFGNGGKSKHPLERRRQRDSLELYNSGDLSILSSRTP